MTDRAIKRPDHVKPPKHWTATPAPKGKNVTAADDDPLGLNPVRYGDWELKGIAVDF
jgi:Protein of unknown function (DUF1674)